MPDEKKIDKKKIDKEKVAKQFSDMVVFFGVSNDPVREAELKAIGEACAEEYIRIYGDK